MIFKKVQIVSNLKIILQSALFFNRINYLVIVVVILQLTVVIPLRAVNITL